MATLVIVLAAGCVILGVGLSNGDWYFEDRPRGKMWVNLLGRESARWLHVLIGLALVIIGFAGLLA